MPSSRSAAIELTAAVNSHHTFVRWQCVMDIHGNISVLHGFGAKEVEIDNCVGFRRKKMTKVIFVGGE